MKSWPFLIFIYFWIGRRGQTAGTSGSLLKKTRAMIDANRVIRLYLKGVVDSQSIKVKSAALVTAWFIIARSRRTTSHADGEGGWQRGDEAPSFVLISPDVMCEAHFGNYPWKISMSRSIVIKWFKGRGLCLFKWYSSHAQRPSLCFWPSSVCIEMLELQTNKKLIISLAWFLTHSDINYLLQLHHSYHGWKWCE